MHEKEWRAGKTVDGCIGSNKSHPAENCLTIAFGSEELISSSSFWFVPNYKVFNCTLAFNRVRVCNKL